jgi:tetratricopeptide (TPR) repeat protein
MNRKPSFLSLIMLAIALYVSSCVSTISVADLQHNAETAYESGKYEQALTHYESLIENWNSNNPREENPYYDKAGHAALGMNDFDKASAYFSQSMHYGTASDKTYQRLVEHYRQIDNISREMITLEAYSEAFPEQAKNDDAHNRLFVIYTETSQWEKAEKQWEHVSAQQDEPLLIHLFTVKNKLGRNEEIDELTQQLLAINPDNIEALEWVARKYYERAETRYEYELQAYEQNKTRSQYSRLLEGYEIAGQDYRKARDIYEKLYKMKPERRYAIFLHNIYARFQDEERAAYYRSRMQ